MAATLGRWFAGSPPATLGVRDGTLAPCPKHRNCVSSRATDARQAVAPFVFEGTAEEAWRRLVDAVRAAPGACIVRHDASYLHAEFTSALLGFVDDAEFVLDAAARTIHLRSASRVGRSDFGVNRARIERLRPFVPGSAR